VSESPRQWPDGGHPSSHTIHTLTLTKQACVMPVYIYPAIYLLGTTHLYPAIDFLIFCWVQMRRSQQFEYLHSCTPRTDRHCSTQRDTAGIPSSPRAHIPLCRTAPSAEHYPRDLKRLLRQKFRHSLQCGQPTQDLRPCSHLRSRKKSQK